METDHKILQFSLTDGPDCVTIPLLWTRIIWLFDTQTAKVTGQSPKLFFFCQNRFQCFTFFCGCRKISPVNFFLLHTSHHSTGVWTVSSQLMLHRCCENLQLDNGILLLCAWPRFWCDQNDVFDKSVRVKQKDGGGFIWDVADDRLFLW